MTVLSVLTLMDGIKNRDLREDSTVLIYLYFTSIIINLFDFLGSDVDAPKKVMNKNVESEERK